MAGLTSQTFSGVQIKNLGFPFTVEDLSNFITLRVDTLDKVVYIRNKLDVGVLQFQSIDPNSGPIPAVPAPNEILVHPSLTYTTIKAGVAAATLITNRSINNPIIVKVYPTVAGYTEDNPISIPQGIIIEGTGYTGGLGILVKSQNTGNLFQDSNADGVGIVEFRNLFMTTVPDPGDSAIFASSQEIKVKGCTFVNCTRGIFLDATANGLNVENSTFINATPTLYDHITDLSSANTRIKCVQIESIDGLVSGAIVIGGTLKEYFIHYVQMTATTPGTIVAGITSVGTNITGEIQDCQINDCTGAGITYGGTTTDNRINSTIIRNCAIGIDTAAGGTVGIINGTDVTFESNTISVDLTDGGAYIGVGGIIDQTIVGISNIIVSPYENIVGNIQGFNIRTFDDPTILLDSVVLTMSVALGVQTSTGMFKMTSSGDMTGGFLKYKISNNSLGIGTITIPDTITGSNNTCIGNSVGSSITNGSNNVGLGNLALVNLTSGAANVAIGILACNDIISGSNNVAIGSNTLSTNITGDNNVCIGSNAGDMIRGASNVCLGVDSGRGFTFASNNIAIGQNTFLASPNFGNGNIGIGNNSCASITTGANNAGIGSFALNDVTTGIQNSCLGIAAGSSITTGDCNACLGDSAGTSITTGINNIAIGLSSMSVGPCTGMNNVAIGTTAGIDITDGTDNVCVGRNSGANIKTGDDNICIGRSSGTSMTTSSDNTCIGLQSGQFITTGASNTFLGHLSGRRNTTGSFNVGIGQSVMNGGGSITGGDNVAIGREAGEGLTSGTHNVMIGRRAGWNGPATGDDNIIIGRESAIAITTANENVSIGTINATVLSTGVKNVLIGTGCGTSLTTGSNNIAIGNASGTAITTVSNNIAIANAGTDTAGRIDIGTSGTHTTCFIQGISGVVTAGAAVPVLIDASGQLGTTSSARRYKHDIQDLEEGKALKLLELQPVSFKFNKSPEFQQYGLIADDVELIMPDMVMHKDGQVESVHYERFDAYYIKMIQMLWTTVGELKAEVANLKSKKKKSCRSNK